MFHSAKKNRNKKELEYNKMRSVSRKEDSFRWIRYMYKIFFYFLTVIFLAVTLYAVFFSPFLAVREVKIEGLKSLDLAEVSTSAKDVYEGKYFKIIPKTNYLLFPKNHIVKKLSENFKRIKNIEIEKQFPDIALIRIEERDSLLLWCDSSDGCFMVDESGYAFQNVKLDSREVTENNLTKIVSQEDRKAAEGEKVMDSQKVHFFLDAKEVMRNHADIEISAEATVKSKIAEEAVLESIEGWNILTSTSFSLERAGKTLKLFLEKELSEDDRKKLEYVDLRVENRIYYKLKKEEEHGEEEYVIGESSEDSGE